MRILRRFFVLAVLICYGFDCDAQVGLKCRIILKNQDVREGKILAFDPAKGYTLLSESGDTLRIVMENIDMVRSEKRIAPKIDSAKFEATLLPQPQKDNVKFRVSTEISNTYAPKVYVNGNDDLNYSSYGLGFNLLLNLVFNDRFFFGLGGGIEAKKVTSKKSAYALSSEQIQYLADFKYLLTKRQKTPFVSLTAGIIRMKYQKGFTSQYKFGYKFQNGNRVTIFASLGIQIDQITKTEPLTDFGDFTVSEYQTRLLFISLVPSFQVAF